MNKTVHFYLPSEDNAMRAMRAILALRLEVAVLRVDNNVWVIEPTGMHLRDVFRVMEDFDGELCEQIQMK